MKLPKAQNAYIPSHKLNDYLLSKTHPVGRWKSKLFRGFGYDETKMDFLERQLLDIANSENVEESITSKHGTKYVVEGSLETPSGHIVKLRTIWVVDESQDRPRFVTAYPV